MKIFLIIFKCIFIGIVLAVIYTGWGYWQYPQVRAKLDKVLVEIVGEKE